MATVKPALNGKTLGKANAAGAAGLMFERYFTDGKISPFDKIEWEKRTALIGNGESPILIETGQALRQRRGPRPAVRSTPARSTPIRQAAARHGVPPERNGVGSMPVGSHPNSGLLRSTDDRGDRGPEGGSGRTIR